MKKLLSLFCAIFMTTVIFAGCSSSKNEKKEESTVRTITTVKGDIEVPANPKRVVANWYVGEVITLGLNLVGYNAWEQETMPFYDKLKATKKIKKWEPEEVMNLKPDLIITYDEADFDKFSKVAPVLVIPESENSIDRIKFIGAATGRTTEAKEAVNKFEKKLDAVKKTLKSDKFVGKTFSIMEDWGPTGEFSGIYYETGSRGGTLVYDYLGLKYPDKLKELIEKSKKGRGSISYEVAHEYFGDYILWFQQEGKESKYSKTDIWKSIPAVAAGRVVEIPGKYSGLFYYSDITSLTEQLDYMSNAINLLVK
ncbi:ABC transporter substrate-binding protein [Clostridium botulinum]|uniref:ABC transporter substrate-binding protein n=1 Tax=Clostridium botulinum TaxID=1491 RepID=UPI000947681C|nr:ABC transporter substrate-binding protein [Clostridium botulinum]APQ74074.1 periplasmic binding family protein [Clostridium botulinum]MBY6899793.1 ABC transporter substrate-binding protein [Clostridium botulinum]MBY6913906.1 ABC transporter substrate-binding protein [Clostridium botulinum]NFM78942.1 Fe3+-hydroxamate ABC transporter substrate-binding protein [Clostridium botulinum]